jgi:hypothetical protein
MMNQTMMLTPRDIIDLVLKICAAIAAVSVAINWIIQWVQRAKKPNALQDALLSEHEKRIAQHDDMLKKHEEYLTRDKKRFEEIERGNRLTQEAILALLSHALDGNNLSDLETSRDHLHDYLYVEKKEQN